MYKLLINTETQEGQSANWQEADISSKDVIALTYHANDIAELKSRQVDRSNNVKLPRTSNNDLIFGVSTEPNSLTDKPYRYLDCRLFDDGVELFGRGAKLKLVESNTKEHVVGIYGGMVDLFSILRSTPLRELDLGDCDWNLQSIVTANNSPTLPFISYPIMEWYIDGDPAFINENKILAHRLYPAVNFKMLCDRILKDLGYELKLPDRILNDERYNSAVIPFGRMQISDAESEAAKKGKASGVEQSFNFTPNNETFPYQFNNSSGNFTLTNNGTYAEFTALKKGSYVFRVEANIISNSGARAYIHVGSPSNSYSKAFSSFGAEGIFTNWEVVDLNMGEKATLRISAHVFMMPSVGFINFSANINCMGSTLDGSIKFGEGLNIASNLPDITCEDVFFLLSRQWCLIPVVDEKNKVLKFYGFEEIYANKKKGLGSDGIKDWSDKLDDREHKTAFRWNSYAQNNIIKYKEEDGIGDEELKINSEGSFVIEDYTLDREKVLFELPAGATQETTHNNQRMAIVDAGNGQPDIKAKYLMAQKSSIEWIIEDEENNTQVTINDSFIAKFSPVGMDMFINEYSTIENGLLKRARLVVEKLYLTPIDLIDFDHSIPVYLSKYAYCFYVNKINNYIPGRLTQVELIPLRPL